MELGGGWAGGCPHSGRREAPSASVSRKAGWAGLPPAPARARVLEGRGPDTHHGHWGSGFENV